MMPIGKLFGVVTRNSVRNRNQFLLSGFGIVVGIAAFVFFLGLSMGVRGVVLGEIFPLEQVEVIAPRASLLGVDMTKRLTDDIVEKIRERPEVEQAIPRMALAFPAVGRGWFDGNELKFELIGDGVHPSFIDDPDIRKMFIDYEEAEKDTELAACGPAPKFKCEGLRYCDKRDMTCHHRVPVIVSRHLLEIYSSQFAKSRSMPVIGQMEEFIVARGGLTKMRLYIGLGHTMVAAANKNLKAEPRQVEGVLLGLSDKAIPIGITMPISYIREWNREFLGDEAAGEYSSIIVSLKNKDDVGPFGAWLLNEMDLRLEDSQGERFAWVILIVTSLFILISLVIVVISAINIAHNFFMQVSERRKEIGVLRAIGATQADVRGIILGEAALLGLLAGCFGVLFAVGSGFVIDLLSAKYLPAFPFKPETYFDFQWWILLGGLLFSVVFCVLGGFFPARKAALMQPARALAER
jgi:ABC-type antimicrobial peptide transport system permease subunit